MEAINYEMIKALAKAHGCKVTDLIALAPQNDLFYAGTPSDRALGEWFADLWAAFGYHAGVHIRRVHYQIISQDPPVRLPNGLPYVNTETCWNVLNLASKAARYLGLVDPAAFVDRRNPEAVTYEPTALEAPAIYVAGRLWGDETALPDFPELPGYELQDYVGQQLYHTEIWCEKSTVNDVLLPLCQSYGATLQTGLGELSITATLALVQRLEASGRPARIFYVSDFDPAGQSMPVAVARKAEYFIRSLELEIDVRLFPVVLTAGQVRQYRLPRTPIKETERRRDSFEQQHGTGAVELDALEALYPGELRRILSSYIEQYYDTTLDRRVREARQALQAELSATQHAIIDRHADAVQRLQDDYAQLRGEFLTRMEAYTGRLATLWETLTDELEEATPDPDDYPVPEARAATEIGDGLYNSARDYLDQLRVYKAHQGKAATAYPE